MPTKHEILDSVNKDKFPRIVAMNIGRITHCNGIEVGLMLMFQAKNGERIPCGALYMADRNSRGAVCLDEHDNNLEIIFGEVASSLVETLIPLSGNTESGVDIAPVFRWWQNLPE